jgi:hypothetical protein
VPVLSFLAFDTESGYDHVTIYDGTDDTATELVSLHGDTVPDDVTASDADLYVELTSDSSTEGTGFAASFTCQAASGQGGGQGRRLKEKAVSQVEVHWPDRWNADWLESNNRPGRLTTNQIAQHSIPDQVRDKHRKLLERHKEPSANRSTPRRILQSGARAATPVGLVSQLSDLIGQPRKTNLQTRIANGKIPRTNSNLDPDGDAKPAAPPQLVAPPPPSKPQTTVLESLQDAGFKFNKQIEGYVFFVPAEFTIEHTKGDVQNLANFRWLDSRTRQLTIRLALYNGGFRRGRTHFQTFYGRQSLAFGLS